MFHQIIKNTARVRLCLDRELVRTKTYLALESLETRLDIFDRQVSSHNMSQSVYVMIDSNDRDKGAYPNPASYTVNLDPKIDRIKGFEVLLHDIPFQHGFLVAGHNNVMYIDNHQVVLPHGDYDTPADLKQALAQVMPRPDLQVDILPYSRKLRIWSADSNDFGLRVVTPGLTRILGGLTHEKETEIVSPYPVNLSKDSYCMLGIERMDVINPINPYRPKFNTIIPMYCQNDATMRKTFEPMIPRLDRLRITFRRPNNQLVDFNGAEHFMLLKFDCA